MIERVRVPPNLLRCRLLGNAILRKGRVDDSFITGHSLACALGAPAPARSERIDRGRYFLARTIGAALYVNDVDHNTNFVQTVGAR